MKRQAETEHWTQRKCPVCGKIFYLQDVTLWVYKMRIQHTSTVYFCSWRCLRAEETAGNPHMKSIKRPRVYSPEYLADSRRAVEMRQKGMTYRQIADTMGIKLDKAYKLANMREVNANDG